VLNDHSSKFIKEMTEAAYGKWHKQLKQNCWYFVHLCVLHYVHSFVTSRTNQVLFISLFRTDQRSASRQFLLLVSMAIICLLYSSLSDIVHNMHDFCFNGYN
jgi:hypothetical protein